MEREIFTEVQIHKEKFTRENREDKRDSQAEARERSGSEEASSSSDQDDDNPEDSPRRRST